MPSLYAKKRVRDLPCEIDSGNVCRREIIKPQKIPSHVVDGLERIANKRHNRIAALLAEGRSVMEISRQLRLGYDLVWYRARKLTSEARRMPPPLPDFPPEGRAFEVLELFAEAQSCVPNHVRR